MEVQMSYSKEIYNSITNFLDNYKWKYVWDEEQECIKLGIRLKGKITEIRVVIVLGDNDYMVLADLPLKANSQYFLELVKLLNLINYGMVFGCFEMDIRDGEIRFRNAVDCQDRLPSEKIVQKSIILPAVMFEQYGEQILDVMLGEKKAEEAYKEDTSFDSE